MIATDNQPSRYPPLSRRALVAGLAALPAWPAFAQFRVEVTGVGMTQLPIALPPFVGEAALPQPISAIVRADLERSGRFRAIAAADPVDESTQPDLAQWRGRGADALVGGSAREGAGGRWDIRFRLWDAVQGRDLGGQGWLVPKSELRLAAHRAADYIYEKLTGERGIFSTRIAYITRSGRSYTLWVADADGENAQAALTSRESIISPAWSPDGKSLAYVSFESRKPVVYVQEVASGKRRLLANFRGSNSAPTWSPDGRTLAVTLSRDGGSQLYLIGVDGGGLRRVTETRNIETEPAYAPDGASLYFVSDRGGSPQIYRMPAGGGGAERVTFEGGYNVSPSVSADGRWLAYVSRVSGAFRVHVMELATGKVTALTEDVDDEHPSFAPNSRLIVYATGSGGGRDLMTTTLDGRIKARLTSGGDIRQPAWGPFQR